MINRNNYEEYFLLYVDKELDQAQRAAVESFVQQNPDLLGELEMLKHATLAANDNIQFDAKDLLYKNNAGISLSNYEEYFLLSIDNELSVEEEKELEHFILKHPQVQDEYTILQQAILTKEVVRFEDKSKLYRSEKKQWRIPVAFIRMSVAASVIGIIATLFMLNGSNTEQQNNGGVAVHQPGVKPQANLSADIKVTSPVTSQATAPLHTKVYRREEVVSTTDHSSKPTNRVKAVETPAPVKKNNEANLTREQEIAVVQQPKLINERLSTPENTYNQNATTNSDVNVARSNVETLTSTAGTGSLNKEDLVKRAVYHEIENEEEDNSLYIGAAEFNKTKLKGLLRKAVNFFDKKTNKNTSDRTVQIASFQIKGR